MMLPDRVTALVEAFLGTSVTGSHSVSGGCIAQAIRIATDSGPYFLKWSGDEVARTFVPEAAGLRALRTAADTLVVPAPLLAQPATASDPGVLLTDWLEVGREGPEFWESFGRGLADLHRHTAERYGFDTDNFIGRLPQENGWMTSWPDFFAARRLEPQVRIARSGGRWRAPWNAAFDNLLARLDSLLPSHPAASVLHGDLWSGNFLVTTQARAALFDPAAYFGHREADLAMTELFGGFEKRFYTAYNEAWPLDAGYPERRDIYNLYHVINHLNHFGSGYAGSVERILRPFR